MELFQLRSLLAVEKAGSITRAAEALHLTQPAVTQQLQSLERELGVKLTERTRRGVRLTEAGLALREQAQQALARLEEGRQRVADLRTGAAGRLTLGAGVTTSVFHLPRWLGTFRRAYPNVEIVVRTGRSREIAALVVERELDLGFVTSPVEHPELAVRALHEEEIVFVAPPDHPLAQVRRLRAAHLADAPLILFSVGSGFRDYMDRALSDAGIAPHVRMETDSFEALKSFVAAGLGVSFLPSSALRAEVKEGRLRRRRVEGLSPLLRVTSVVHHTNRYLSAAARGFLEALPGR
jgi:DNA-binding transcriptional LysR family regulator